MTPRQHNQFQKELNTAQPRGERRTNLMSIKTSRFSPTADHNDLAPLSPDTLTSGDADHASSLANLKGMRKHEKAQAIDQDAWSDKNRVVGGLHTAQSLSDHLEHYDHSTVSVHDGSQDGKTTKHRTSKTSDEQL
jgi:hypothetical protein